MSQVTRTANHCDVCSHEWLPTPGVVYTHCTSSKCRSRKWDSQHVEPMGDLNKLQPKRRVEVQALINTNLRSAHDPKTCRIYKCGMCALAK